LTEKKLLYEWDFGEKEPERSHQKRDRKEKGKIDKENKALLLSFWKI